MNDFLTTIGREWERNLLLAIASVIACIGGFYAYQYLNHEEEPEDSAKKKPELPSYYAVALLDGAAVPSMTEGINPMSCEFLKPEPPKPPPKKPWNIIPKPPKTEPPKTEPPKVRPTPPKPVPPKPPRVVELRYIGNMSIDGGNAAAQLYVSEVISKKQKNTFKQRLRVGEKILGGLLEIKSFDKDKVVVVHSGNKEVRVPIRQKKPTVISVPQ